MIVNITIEADTELATDALFLSQISRFDYGCAAVEPAESPKADAADEAKAEEPAKDPEPAAAAEPEPAAEEAPKPEPKKPARRAKPAAAAKTDDVPSFDVLRDAAMKAFNAGKRAEFTEVLRSHGVDKVTEVAEGERAALLAEVEALYA